MSGRVARFFGNHWRLLAGVVAALTLLVVLGALLLVLQADAVVKRAAAAFAPHASIEYRTPRVQWNGDLAVQGLRVTPAGRRASLVAETATLRAPGLLWLMRAAFSKSGDLPALDRVGLTLDNVSVEGNGGLAPQLDWLGVVSASPFEAAGCGERRRWTTQEMTQLAPQAQPSRAEITYRVLTPGTAAIEARITAPGSSRVEHTRTLRVTDPTRPLSPSGAPIGVVNQRWTIQDDGFVTARNRYCARVLRVTRNLFVERHLGAIEAMLLRQRLVASPELMEAYRRFSSRGGSMTWESRPAVPLVAAQIDRLPLAEQFRVLNAKLTVPGRGDVPFVVSNYDVQLSSLPPDGSDPMGPPEPVTPTTTPAATTPPVSIAANAPVTPTLPPVTPDPAPVRPPPITPNTTSVAATTTPPPVRPTPAPAAPASVGSSGTPTVTSTTPPRPVAPVPTATPKTAPAPVVASNTPVPSATTPGVKPPATTTRPTAPRAGAITYDGLARAVGRRIAVNTVHSTRRVGLLRDHNSIAITLELSGDDRGKLLTLPRETVIRAELLDDVDYFSSRETPKADAEKN